MDIYKYLNQVFYISKKIKIIDLEIKSLRDSLKAIDYTKESIVVKQNFSSVEVLVEKIQKEESKLLKLQVAEAIKKKEIINQINKLENSLYSEVLFLRFIKFKNWYDISRDINYSLRQTHEIKNKALKELSKIINN